MDPTAKALQAKGKQVTLEECNTLIHQYWEQSSKATPRERTKPLRQASFYIQLALSKGVSSVEQVDFYLVILQTLKKTHGFPGDVSKIMSRAIAVKLQILDIPEPQILSKKMGSVSVESGTLVLKDYPTKLQYNDYSEKELVKFMNNKQALYVDTGGDFTVKAELRHVSGHHPILTSKEYKKLSGSSQVVTINLTEGQPVLSDLHEEDLRKMVSIKVPAGTYATAAHLVEKSRYEFKFVFVIATASSDSQATITSVERLEP